jgi:ATP phosphoribosyltransferase
MLPGMKSPTVLPLAESGWSSIHSVLIEDDFWKNIENIRKAGAQGILVVPIEKIIN